MENNNGRGIFYGVIGVATLVVAIIGATFAYFSASAASNNAINVKSTEITLSITGETRNFYSDLIPVDTTTTANKAAFAKFPGLVAKTETLYGLGAEGKGTNTCSDIVGNSICSVYQFTIGNPSSNTASQTVYGRMEITENKFPLMTEAEKTGVTPVGSSNLHYAVFKGEASKLYGNFNLDGKVGNVTVSDTVMVQGKTAIKGKDSVERWTDNTKQLLAPGESQTYTIVVWLEENGAFNSGDQGKLFTAAVKFDTAAGGSGVTGQLVAGA